MNKPCIVKNEGKYFCSNHLVLGEGGGTVKEAYDNWLHRVNMISIELQCLNLPEKLSNHFTVYADGVSILEFDRQSGKKGYTITRYDGTCENYGGPPYAITPFAIKIDVEEAIKRVVKSIDKYTKGAEVWVVGCTT